ncbi:hypothetical protein AB0K51_21970 [Kitasatospora sp. NPDC049285]|uniref:hypothetical protein n=1 Tax=Kitasatospora sp. NPDC049285 TaxID=3157096 RepID=UPI00342A9278
MSRQSTDPGDTLVRVGGIVFGVGMLATIATFVPLFLDLPRLPTVAYWLCMLMPAGLLVSLTGLFTTARADARKRRAAAASA